jgi:RHS repeat-associated protein
MPENLMIVEPQFYTFGFEFGGDLNISDALTPSYRYSSQGQEKQLEPGWSSYRWRNYDAGMARFFNVDPLSEKYTYQSHYNFSENKVISYRELEGLEAIDANKVREAFDMEKKGKAIN